MNRFVDDQSGNLTKTGCLLFGLVVGGILLLLGQQLLAWINGKYLF